jgi:hypothetical protein
MGIFCGARKSFLEFSLCLRIPAEPFDLQQEIPRAQSTPVKCLRGEIGRIICAKEIPAVDYHPVDVTNLCLKCKSDYQMFLISPTTRARPGAIPPALPIYGKLASRVVSASAQL